MTRHTTPEDPVNPLRIAAKYHGPPQSGNGGYCCGLFAARLNTNPLVGREVTLRQPPPLEKSLGTVPCPEGIEIRDGDQLIAQIREANVDIQPRPAPAPALAREAQHRYAGFTSHPFPHCFVCGPERAEGDGLRLFPGALNPGVEEASMVACVWQPYPALGDSQGNLRAEFIWAALDCPTYFGAFMGEGTPLALLGRQALRQLRTPLPADQNYLVQSWPLGSDARKHLSAGALYTLQGECVALCRATWITL